MRNLPQLPDSYFVKFKEKPVKIVPFNPKAKIIAAEYIKKLQNILINFKIEFVHRGSTAYGIAGKGEIEIGVYPLNKDWNKVLKELKANFGKIDNLEKNYARFNDFFKGFEIEVIVMRGDEARIDKKLNDYLLEHPDLLIEYEKLKTKYSFSRKEYMIQKDRFFRKVVSRISGFC